MIAYRKHIFLLFVFCFSIVFFWMLPVFLSGYSYEIPLLHPARNYSETNTFALRDEIGRYVIASDHPAINSAKDGRLSTVIFGQFSNWIPWDNLVGWAMLGCCLFSLSLIPLWMGISSFFNNRVAWISIVLTALMPIYWKEAVNLSNFHLAFLFEMCSLASFIILRKKPILALIISGIFWGLSIASKDLFLIFAPWYVFMYLWYFRSNWRRLVVGPLIFFGLGILIYFLFYIGDIDQYGYPRNWNLARLWPGAEEIANETYLHLYRDPYTFLFDREVFDSEILSNKDNMTSLEWRQMQKTLLAYDVVENTFFNRLTNGFWLFINSIPSFFHINTIGGVFLWIFIIPGGFLLWRDNKNSAIFLAGLVITTYIIIRFILGYNREHFMDIGWIFAIVSALGIVFYTDFLRKVFPKISIALISSVVLLVISMQLVQSNRIEFARLYRGTLIPDTVSISHAMSQIPSSSVIASPISSMRISRIVHLSGKTNVPFAGDTISKLLENGKLSEVFEQYGVTHIARYNEELESRIQDEIPSIAIIDDLEPGSISPNLNSYTKYLLNIIY